MDKITKALKNFSVKEKNFIKEILLKLKSGDFINLEIKKLKGYQDIYRMRKGKIRIIYKKTDNQIKLLIIERRSDKTYRDL